MITAVDTNRASPQFQGVPQTGSPQIIPVRMARAVKNTPISAAAAAVRSAIGRFVMSQRRDPTSVTPKAAKAKRP